MSQHKQSWLHGALSCFVLLAAGCAPVASPITLTPAPSTQATTQPTTAESKPPIVLGENTIVAHDINYAASSEPLQTLDIYAPRDARNAPVVIFIHGGGWTGRDKDEVSAQPRLFNSRGIVLVAVNYRLAPKVKHPEQVEDIATAIAWTKMNIARHGGNAANIFVMGHSAGSHLAALVATNAKYLQKHGLKPSDLAGVISLDGSAFDIPERIAKGGEKLAENCRRAFGTDPLVQADASPINHVDRPGELPRFLFVYLKPGSLNHSQSQRMADRLNTLPGRAKVLHLAAPSHQALCDDLGTSKDTAGESILEFIAAR